MATNTFVLNLLVFFEIFNNNVMFQKDRFFGPQIPKVINYNIDMHVRRNRMYILIYGY